MLVLLYRLYHVRNGSTSNINFGCFGAAKIAPGALINPSRTHPEVILYAVAARDTARAEAFAKSTDSRRAMRQERSQVDVIYNPLPNGLHFEWTMKALKGGKHVLLEKPATNTAAEAAQIYSLAAAKSLVVLEAFHYRFHPAVQRVKAILESKELGAIKSIRYELGGGSTMDPGCYTVNALRYLASANPTAVLTASAHDKVDKMFTATLALEHDIIGELHSNLCEPKLFGIIPRIPKLTATVRCEAGTVEIFNFLIPSYYHYITVTPTGKLARVEKAYTFEGAAKGEDWWTTYRYQLEAFVDKIQGRTPQTWVEPQDTIDNMKWIEEIYAKDGFGSRPPSKYVYEEN
ncbi:hypothetical protein B0H10DRAFT_1978944 [Mycena sp. CBHHK59/15]|nr:hypothetical protein B0H10DRAFT_1978944 [Mycena sp. CBHHK59/15]